MSKNAEKYGQFFWRVGLTDGDGEGGADSINFFADEVKVDNGGTLYLIRHKEGGHRYNAVFPRGAWTLVYAISVMDGHAVAIDDGQE